MNIEIKSGNETYVFNTGDFLMMNPKAKTYAHTKPTGEGRLKTFLLLGAVPSEVIPLLMSQLKQVKKWPPTYEVIGNVEVETKEPKPNDQKLAEIYEDEQLDETDNSIEISKL